jgi:flagellar hook-length control protein FliK
MAATEQAELSGALLTPALHAAAPAKNNKTATVGFAEFQKAANAALAQQQKQQTEAQQQSGQQGAVQSDTAAAELTIAQPGVVPHDQSQLASTLVATEKALSGTGFSQTGSQSGGHSQHQSQQSFSQILATKQLDNQIQNQPSLSLLEPTAANQLKERVMFQVNQKIQSADIRLAPEELGSVQIKINLQQEQLSVQFVVQQTAAKEALEQQMPRLKELLQEQGMALTDGQVHQQQQEQQSQQDERRTASGRAGSRNTQDDDAEVAAQQVQIAVSDRMVDYYA